MKVLRRRFTVDDYYRMAQAGILSEDDRVELIEGEIIQMTGIGSRHANTVTQLTMLFATRLAGRAVVSVQNPVRLSFYTEPQPDVVLLRPRSYADAHPRPEDVFLLVEVSDTTLPYDRDVKLPLYARAGVREVWIVDLEAEAIHIYRAPAEHGFTVTEHRSGDQPSCPEAFPDVGLNVGEIL
jgi:hypothetical protein